MKNVSDGREFTNQVSILGPRSNKFNSSSCTRKSSQAVNQRNGLFICSCNLIIVNLDYLMQDWMVHILTCILNMFCRDGIHVVRLRLDGKDCVNVGLSWP